MWLQPACGRVTSAFCLHDDWDEDGGAEFLEQDVGERLEDGVRHEEDGKGGVVAGRAHAQVFGEAGDFGVADVGAVKEGQQVEEAELGEVSDVDTL
jgi:hypothetical protein